jgi:hypothetical protein
MRGWAVVGRWRLVERLARRGIQPPHLGSRVVTRLKRVLDSAREQRELLAVDSAPVDGEVVPIVRDIPMHAVVTRKGERPPVVNAGKAIGLALWEQRKHNHRVECRQTAGCSQTTQECLPRRLAAAREEASAIQPACEPCP